ncbi:unnamed protein product [Lactuca saligna]|uniref:Uncharacterized protein n=1 Tax=Lactuca saligna TaxID=75948 RepID=A0AA35ZI31_LACSI|nr:unnamed protein product [Lactuca saligna]
MKMCFLTMSLSRINEEVIIIADNWVFKIDEDDEDAISSTVFETDEALEDSEIELENDTEQIPESENERSSSVDDVGDFLEGRATVSPGEMGNQHEMTS